MQPIKATLGPHLFTISEDADLGSAVLLLQKSQGLPLVALNLKKEITGLLTARNLGETVNTTKADKTIQDIMSRACLVVPKNSLLKDLCQKMLDESIAGFFISDQGQIDAAIGSEDLLKIIHRILVNSKSSSSLDNIFFQATVEHYLENRSSFDTEN